MLPFADLGRDNASGHCGRLILTALRRASEVAARAQAWAKSGGAFALNLIWPAHSLLSRQFVSRPGEIEPELWSALTFLTEPCCHCCGFPFETDLGAEALCLACEADRPVFNRARAALAYDETSRKLALDLKHGGRRDGLPTFGSWLAHAAPFAREADILVATPLHYSRLIKRGHNQAVWLAQALGKTIGKPVHPQALIRHRRTPSQGGLSAAGRARNVQGAFRVSPKYEDLVAGKKVLLVDDVFTTGATVEACARTLKRAGATSVDVVCLTRVVRPVSAPI